MIAQIAAAAQAAELAVKVTTSLDIPSARQSFDMWELSRVIAGSAVLTREFDAGVDGLLDRLRESTEDDASAFVAKWDSFLERWGFLGRVPGRSARRRTRPIRSSRCGCSITLARHRAAPHRVIDRAHCKRSVTRPSRRSPSAGVFLPGREQAKLHRTRMTEEMRANVRELGRRFVERGVLTSWDQLLLLSNDEIDGFLADPGRSGRLIAGR